MESLSKTIADNWLMLAAIIVVAFFLNWLLQILLGRTSDKLRARAPGDIEPRGAILVDAAAITVRYAILLAALLLVLKEIKLDPLVVLIGPGLGRIAVIIILAILADSLTKRLLYGVAQRLQKSPVKEVGERAATLVRTVASLAKYAIFFVAALMILSELGINLAPLLAGAGIAGLAVGFGAQSLVRDVVSGFFILLEDQYGIGDMVEINGKLGTVEIVGLRMTRLRDLNGQAHYFPNGSIAAVQVFPDAGLPYILQVPTALEQTKELRAFIREIVEDFNNQFDAIIAGPDFLEKKRLSTYASVLEFEISLYPLRQAVALEKLPLRLKAALDRAGHPLPEGTEIAVLPALSEDH